MVLEEKESEEELPPPKRHRFHPGKWFATFGEKSENVALSGRSYQFKYLGQWDIDADAESVEGYDQQVVYNDEDVNEALDTMVTAMSK